MAEPEDEVGEHEVPAEERRRPIRTVWRLRIHREDALDVLRASRAMGFESMSAYIRDRLVAAVYRDLGEAEARRRAREREKRRKLPPWMQG